ncbi:MULTISPECIES: paraquat-inducible protein A [unclassified Neisseria]|uniref:paraquat-inducible protein A n=1 Tax=unclassified Neisseria TaxID=2623750 RepID=UPI002665A214|nr:MULTISPECIES: paraquat-inducible protein A [unclassified Neisseria]MDO1508922.1 paraquat-inducible protein A [Neisseria sp. MVDL19-042950]MDO1515181.1 paraquat-inducible protein A [Neisseria sp. MVDL18-041461]MDO1562541.1 paraquat-inducible protein A [Neisseria sp. MVDL20-010259]
MKFARAYRRWWRYRTYRSDATLPAHSLDCPECGQRMMLPRLRQGQEAHCPRCGYEVVEIEKNPYIAPLAYAVASLVLMAFVYNMMFVTVTMAGVTSILSLPSMMKQLILLDFGFLAEVMFVLTFGTPLLFLLLCIYVYTALIRDKIYPGLFYATRTLVRLRHWIMVDVFFISTLVSYIKLSSVARVEFGAAFYLMFGLAVMLIRTSVAIPQHWVYYKIHHMLGRNAVQTASEEHICCSRCLYFRDKTENTCGVCGADLYRRRPQSLSVSMAFLAAAIVLYVPANVLPIMISSNPATVQINTIFNGIVYMWNDGDKLIAMIIFSASILVPVAKIVSLLFLIGSARFGLPMGIHKMSLLYRFTEAVGKWSMIDIFVIIVLMSAFHTNLARVVPGAAAIYFCLVVLLTMLSAYFFDPRLLWDKARNDAALTERPSENAPANQPEYE